MSNSYSTDRPINGLDPKEEGLIGFNTSTPLNRFLLGKDNLSDETPIEFNDSCYATATRALKHSPHNSHDSESTFSTETRSPTRQSQPNRSYGSELGNVFEIQELPGSMKPQPQSLHRTKRWDPRIPYVLLLYLQLVLNVLLVATLIYLGYLVVSTLRADINQKVEMWISDALNEISACSKDYYRNKCHNDDQHTRAPALEQTCNEWEKCMNRDPQQLARSMVTAETLADVLNAFVHRLSLKSLATLFFLVLCSIFVSHVSFAKHKEWNDGGYEQKIRMGELEEQLAKLKNIQTLNGRHYDDPVQFADYSVGSMSSPLSKYTRSRR